MLVKLSSSSLKQTHWYEFGIRFLLGGLATVFAGIVGARFGVAIGGLFLALPAIFCASATLIGSHERRTKEKAGLSGRRRGRQAAALDAAGAGLGSIGLAAFGATFYALVTTSVIGAFAAGPSDMGRRLGIGVVAETDASHHLPPQAGRTLSEGPERPVASGIHTSRQQSEADRAARERSFACLYPRISTFETSRRSSTQPQLRYSGCIFAVNENAHRTAGEHRSTGATRFV